MHNLYFFLTSWPILLKAANTFGGNLRQITTKKTNKPPFVSESQVWDLLIFKYSLCTPLALFIYLAFNFFKNISSNFNTVHSHCTVLTDDINIVLYVLYKHVITILLLKKDTILKNIKYNLTKLHVLRCGVQDPTVILSCLNLINLTDCSAFI